MRGRTRIEYAVAVVAFIGLWPAISSGQSGQESAEQESAEQESHEHSMHPAPEQSALPPNIRPLTDEDRQAAFPDVDGRIPVHDNAVNYFLLSDQLEWQAGSDDSGVSWDNKGWIGRDLDRFWFRTEGESEGENLADAEVHLLYGRAIARWWDVVAGLRQDIRPGPARTWAAIGLQGLAPYWFEVEATFYVGESGRTLFRFETEYEFLLSNRLILQPLFETDIYGKSDPERNIGAGLSSLDAELRLRYEFRREFAPYIGVAWNWKLFETAEFAEAAGESTQTMRLVLGLRLWF